eukprot:scaffold23832_cov57-Phaeocystis_antarctica.AAC.5
MDGFDLVSKKRVNTLRPACRSCQQSCGCRAPSTRSGYWDLRPPSAAGGRPGGDEPAAWGVREHARAPPSPSTLCALSAQAIHAAQGEPGREGRGWYPRTQLEEELDPAAR